MGVTPIGVGRVIVWLERNSPGEVGDGAVEIKRLEVRDPPTKERGGIIGVGFKFPGVIRDGGANLLLLFPIQTLFHGPPKCKRPYHSGLIVSALATDDLHDSHVCQCGYGSVWKC